jgi:hypothetical protein
MKTSILLLNFILIFSCNNYRKLDNKDYSKCEKKIDSFFYPKDLESLIEKNYICDNNIPFIFNDDRAFCKRMKVVFSDKNFMLINFDRKTRILFDRKEDIIIVFKASEIDNFYFNKPEYKELYPLSFYVVDKKFLPKYHFSGNIISVFKDNVNKKKYDEYKVSMKNHKLNINYNLFDYHDLIKTIKELNNGNFIVKEEIGPDILNYFYKNEPIWTEI